jgi:hypothetical protein
LYPGKKLHLKEVTTPIVEVSPLVENAEQELFDPQMSRKRSNSIAGMSAVKGLEPNKGQTLNKSGSKGELGVSSATNESSTTIRDRLKASLNAGGDISDIDKIFEHVINESKRVNESLKAISEDYGHRERSNSFLQFYQGAKDFIEVEQENQVVKSEAYYCTKHGRVKGVLTVADTYIMYDPLFCEENSKFDQDTLGAKFQACLDIKDIVNVDIIKLPNETAVYIQDDEDRK